MASVFGHGIVAYTIAKISSKKIPSSLLFLAIASSILPDVDVIAFSFGIPYEHMFIQPCSSLARKSPKHQKRDFRGGFTSTNSTGPTHLKN